MHEDGVVDFFSFLGLFPYTFFPNTPLRKTIFLDRYHSSSIFLLEEASFLLSTKHYDHFFVPSICMETASFVQSKKFGCIISSVCSKAQYLNTYFKLKVLKEGEEDITRGIILEKRRGL